MFLLLSGIFGKDQSSWFVHHHTFPGPVLQILERGNGQLLFLYIMVPDGARKKNLIHIVSEAEYKKRIWKIIRRVISSDQNGDTEIF